MNPPVAKKIPHTLETHNHKRIDNYYWLRDKENTEVIDYIKAENEYCEHSQKHNESLREELFQEMKGRIKEDDASAPYLSNGYWYYTRFETGKELSIFCRKKESLESEEEILIDENKNAEGHDYYDVVSMAVSIDNKLLLYAEDLTGRRKYEIRLKNLETGEIRKLPLENTSSDLVWNDDNKTIYYIQKDEQTLRAYQVNAFDITTNESTLLFEEKDEKYICGLTRSTDDKHLILGSYSTLTTEFHIKSLSDHLPLEVYLEREYEHEYYLDVVHGFAYIKSNKDGKNFGLYKAPVNNSEKENWQSILRPNDRVYLEDYELFDRHVVVQEKTDGLSRLAIFDNTSFERREIPVDEETYSLYFGINEESHLPYLRIGYTSMTRPSTVYTIDLASLEWTQIKQQPVLGDFRSENYYSERLWIEARDGVKVPCSLVYRKDKFEKDGNNPILVYGYGSYGNGIDPYFSSLRLSLLDRGFVFAIAHIRGGDELGYPWYQEGKLLKKKNTFTDFIDVSVGLANKGYCDADKILAMGGSAGGLLMGAIANMRPDLWAGIVSQVPFVDVVTTMLDETIPLTVGEYEEWGNPNEKEYYDYILSYSPYDQLEAKDYPPTLMISGLHDSQVQYWEPTKYVAKIRDLKTDDNPILLRTNMEAGHGGSAGRFETMKEVAYNYAFLIDLAKK
ncbi:MAG: S9 family peptidase [Crocinitomicaceae bacterium]|nr:S9 family peptidase [Crocinitomicaceae bacterium]